MNAETPTTATPAAPREDGMQPYTVVLDWDGDNGDISAPVIQVYAADYLGAVEAARVEAWRMWAGQIEEIPEDAEYEEGTAEDLWYSVAILHGHAFAANI
jgi:hypothetical protein